MDEDMTMATEMAEMRARFASEAMLTLARQVKDYCGSFPERIAALNECEREKKMRQFVHNANALRDMLHLLKGKAAEVRAMKVLNVEQYEAMVDEVEDILATYGAGSAELN